MKPHVWPVDNAETTELWNELCAAVQRQDLAGDILAMVQKSLDDQAAAIEHAQIVERMTRIFAAIEKQCANSMGDLATYCLALVDLLNHALAVRCRISWSSLRKADAPEWLQKYALTDFDSCADILYESLSSRDPASAVEASRIVCSEFISDLGKNLIVIAQGDRDIASRWDSAVDQMLDDMQNEDGDVFGTEGQCDPRGDRRG